MLIEEKIKHIKLSSNEALIKDFIEQHQNKLKNLTTREVANLTYTSASTVVRFAQKLGFLGWNEFKAAYVDECNYLMRHFNELDANAPFEASDNLGSVAHKIIALKQETLEDTKQLINPLDLQKAVDFINNSNQIKLFGSSNITYELSEFQFKISRINKDISASLLPSDQQHFAHRCQKNDVAIVVSYTGESIELLKAVQQLKQKNIPIIAITSLGDNRLSKFADVTLYVTTREKAYSKIGAFSSLESIRCVLDILYSCVFSQHYDENFNYKKKMGKQLETSRKASNDIIKET